MATRRALALGGLAADLTAVAILWGNAVLLPQDEAHGLHNVALWLIALAWGAGALLYGKAVGHPSLGLIDAPFVLLTAANVLMSLVFGLLAVFASLGGTFGG